MRGFSTLGISLLKSQLREPVGFFFLLVFSPGLLLILGFIFGNSPAPEFGENGFVDQMMPGMITLSLIIVGISSVPQNHLQLRSTGALTRLQMTPLKPSTYIAADIAVNAVLGLIGALLTLVIGVTVFGVTLPANFALVLVALVLGLVSMLAIGYALATFYPSVSAAVGVGNALMIILMLTSGSMIPLATMPGNIQRIAEYSPVHHITQLVSASWDGTSWPLLSALILVGIAAAFGAVAAIRFRWDKAA